MHMMQHGSRHLYFCARRAPHWLPLGVALVCHVAIRLQVAYICVIAICG